MREELKRVFDKYKQILANVDRESIKKVLEELENRRTSINSSTNVKLCEQAERVDDDMKKIFELMELYKSEIKQIFIDKDEKITHITDVAPENMINGKIAKSINGANNYETEKGDWVFASSSPMDGTNPYIARNPQKGMIRIAQKTYIYGGNNMEIQRDEQGNNRVLLKEPNYVYEINPQNFTPVVTLKVDETEGPYFEFSEEWISEQEVDINDSEQIQSKKISDITQVVRKYQVLCDVNMTKEAEKILSSGSIANAIRLLRESIRSGRLRYINREAGVNVNDMIDNIEIVSNNSNDSVSREYYKKQKMKEEIER